MEESSGVEGISGGFSAGHLFYFRNDCDDFLIDRRVIVKLISWKRCGWMRWSPLCLCALRAVLVEVDRSPAGLHAEEDRHAAVAAEEPVLAALR